MTFLDEKDFNGEIVTGDNENRETKDDSVKKGRIISYEDALEELGFGRVQYELLLVIMLVLINVFNETMGISNLIPAAECDLELTPTRKGLLTSIVYFGVMLSSYMFGYLGDVKGRRWVILWTLLFSTIFSIVTVFISNFGLFTAGRFMVGFFVAGYSGNLYSYIGEFNIVKYRSSIISYISIAIGISTVLMPLLTQWLLGYNFKFELYPGYEFKPWRLCLLLYATPGIISMFWLWRFPESPPFLLSINKNDEAYDAFKWIYQQNKRSLKKFDIIKLKPDENASDPVALTEIKSILISIKNQTLPLLKPPHLLHFVVICSLQFGTFWVVSGISLFLPDILNQLSLAREEYNRDFRVCDVAKLKREGNFTTVEDSEIGKTCDDVVNTAIYNDITYLGYAYVVGFIIVALVIRPSRRRVVIGATFLLSAIAGFILPFVYQYSIMVVCFCAHIFFSGINISLVNGAAVDLFPPNLRSMAVTLGMLFGRFGSSVAANIVGNIIDTYCEVTYFTTASLITFCFLISFVITKTTH